MPRPYNGAVYGPVYGAMQGPVCGPVYGPGMPGPRCHMVAVLLFSLQDLLRT